MTWGECATFFGSAVAYDATAAAYSVPWKSLLLARNASSGLSPHLRALARSRPFDTPIEMSEVSAYCTRLLSLDSELVETAAHPLLPAQLPTLRDYQREAVELCCSETESAGYIVLPTGTGKNVVIAESVRRVLARDGDARVLVLVPMIVLLEQLLEILETARSGGPSGPSVEAVAVGGGRTPSAAEIREARLVVCVYNSAASVGAAQFTRVFIDEAHFARPPAMYADLRDDSSISSDEGDIAHAKRERSAVVETSWLGNVRGRHNTNIVRVRNNRPVDDGCCHSGLSREDERRVCWAIHCWRHSVN